MVFNNLLQMQPTFSTFLNFAVLTHCLFGIVYLSAYQWQRNQWLVFIFAIVFSVQFGIFISEGDLPVWQKIFIGNPGAILWLSPCLLFFTKELVSVLYERKGVFIHFLPGVLFYIFFLFTEVNHPATFFSSASEGDYSFAHSAHLAVLLFSTAYYGYDLLKLINFNKRKYKNEYAETSIYLTLDWLKYTVQILVALTFFGILSMPIMVSSGFSFPFEWIELLFLIFVLTISYFSFRQPALYASEDLNQMRNQNEAAKRTGIKPLLSKEKVDALSGKIEEFFLEKRPFLNPKIRMPEIALAMEITPNEFSWYLNEQQKMNFFTFVNRYRVDYAADLLKDENYRHYTLEAISKMAGFQSKTTFNNRFKEIKQVTPSAFRKGNL